MQVRVLRGEATGARDHLGEHGVDTTVVLNRVNEGRAVGAAKFLDLSISKDERHDAVFVLDGFETSGVGGTSRLDLLHRGEPELVEEHDLELLR